MRGATFKFRCVPAAASDFDFPSAQIRPYPSIGGRQSRGVSLPEMTLPIASLAARAPSRSRENLCRDQTWELLMVDCLVAAVAGLGAGVITVLALHDAHWSQIATTAFPLVAAASATTIQKIMRRLP